VKHKPYQQSSTMLGVVCVSFGQFYSPFSIMLCYFFPRTTLAEKYPKLAPLVSNEEYMTLALNEEYVPKGSILPLKPGDVVALIPPISGG